MERICSKLKDAINVMEKLEALDLNYTVKRDRRAYKDISGVAEVETHYIIIYGGRDESLHN